MSTVHRYTIDRRSPRWLHPPRGRLLGDVPGRLYIQYRAITTNRRYSVRSKYSKFMQKYRYKHKQSYYKSTEVLMKQPIRPVAKTAKSKERFEQLHHYLGAVALGAKERDGWCFCVVVIFPAALICRARGLCVYYQRLNCAGRSTASCGLERW